MKQKLINVEYCGRCNKQTKSIKQGATILNLKFICFECGITKYEEKLK